MSAGGDFQIKVTINDSVNYDYTSGRISKSLNSPSQLSLTFPAHQGKNVWTFPNTYEIKVFLGIGVLTQRPIFRGYITKKNIDVSSGTITYICSDLMCLLQQDRITIDQFDNFDGWEAGDAILDIVSNVDDLSSTLTSISTDGITGTSPTVTIKEENNIRSFYDEHTRLDVISAINNLCWDSDNYPSPPLLYRYFMEDKTFYHQKIPERSTSDPLDKIEYADNLLSGQVEQNFSEDLYSKFSIVGAEYTDDDGDTKNYHGTYTHTSTAKAYRPNWGYDSDSSLTSNADCYQEAMKRVEFSRLLRMSPEIGYLRAYKRTPGDIIEVKNSRYGIKGNFIIQNVDVNFSPNNFNSSVVLDTERASIIDYL